MLLSALLGRHNGYTFSAGHFYPREESQRCGGVVEQTLFSEAYICGEVVLIDIKYSDGGLFGYNIRQLESGQAGQASSIELAFSEGSFFRAEKLVIRCQWQRIFDK